MKFFRHILFFPFFAAVSHNGLGQPHIIDSLKHIIFKVVTEKEKLSAIARLSEQTINADSLLPYVVMAETIAATTRDKSDADRASYCRAGYYLRKNMSDSALFIIEKLIRNYKNDKSRQPFYLTLLFLKAKTLDRANQYSKAISQLVEVIQTAEIQKDTLIQIQAKTGIGWVQIEMEQYREALQWLYKAKNTSSNKKFYKNYGALYSNMATAYSALGNPDSAEYYIGIAIRDATENDNFTFLATALSMQAKIYTDSKRPHLAEAPLNKALEIRKKINDPFYTVFDMSNLASYYASNNQPQKGIAICKEGITLAKERGMTSQLLMIYQALAENYKTADKMTEYGQILEYIIALKDSFNNINSSKQIAELLASNETQKKEKQIIEQKLNIAKKNYWLYGSFLFTVMGGIIVWMGFKNYRRKQKIKMQLALEEEKKLSEQAVIDAEEQERKRIAADLHDSLGAYAASIASNLDHLLFTQADETNATPLKELRNNSQAIVSQLGDTIWALKKDSLSLTAISDRLKLFIHRLQPSYPDVALDITEIIETDHLLPPSQAFHLFQSMQEAIINALKHSGGKRVNVIIKGSKTWKISVDDDGSGMNTLMKTGGGGNGLKNMKNRAEEGGWSIDWLQNEYGGTSVIMAPTTN
ncbi:MAG: tetratricopeptide repeat-containing sensor histidine kinase [Bacteroidota bacterium]